MCQVRSLHDTTSSCFCVLLYNLQYFLDDGFCDYDDFESPDDRGRYKWPESKVFESRRLVCSHGPQDVDIGGMAERTCTGNLMWDDYNGDECATFDTAFLRNITAVRYVDNA